MIEFIIGLFCGAMLGILMAGLCVAASDADREMGVDYGNSNQSTT